MTARTNTALLFSALVLALAGCNGATSGLIVAAEGGVVSSETAEVAIPAMSLATDTEVTLETAPASDYPALDGARPEVVRIQPEGTILELPATVTVRAGLIDAGADQRVTIHQLREVDGVERWDPIESTLDEATGDASVSVTRFAPLAIVVEEASTLGEIHGTLHWGDESPVESAPIQLLAADAVVAETTTDATGAFSFADLEPGTYTVSIDYECMVSETVELGAGASEELALILCGG